MQSKEFIRRCMSGDYPSAKVRRMRDGFKRCNSLSWDGDVLYSYSTHYPLLFTIRDAKDQPVVICNDRGYSVTTARHISMARQYAQYSIAIPRTMATSHAITVRGVKEIAMDEIEEQRVAIMRLREKSEKYPHYTGMKRDIQHRQERIASLRELLAILNG